MDLRVDKQRWSDLVAVEQAMTLEGDTTEHGNVTGVMVRAIGPDGRWGDYDIFVLEAESLKEWVRSRGDVSEWAMGLIFILLQYDIDVTASLS